MHVGIEGKAHGVDDPRAGGLVRVGEHAAERTEARQVEIERPSRERAGSTLRFYEEKGLIASVGRRGLRRLFDPAVLERLALIAMGRAAGFSLEEIALMFTPDGRPRIDKKMLAAKADELDRTIKELTAMRNGLRHAAACPARSHMECPTFRRILKAVQLGQRASNVRHPTSR